jgi:hypothetical protein
MYKQYKKMQLCLTFVCNVYNMSESTSRPIVDFGVLNDNLIK